MAIMELKLAQELSSVDHDPLLPVFLDLSKSYDTVGRECLIQTLEGYGAGPRMCGLLETFWAHQKVVPRQNCYHEPDFLATLGTTQGSLVYPTLFNVVVENVIRTWFAMIVEDQRVAQKGMLEAVGQFLVVFYTKDGMVGSIDAKWLQHSMKILVGLFPRG